MVLGLRTKTRNSPSVQLDYFIHIKEIKPWPPSQSLRTLRAVSIQWMHGERTFGSTNQVVPSLGTGSGVGDGRIEFNESFRLTVTLTREIPSKGGDRHTFQKNCIEFNLYEPRRDKMEKGQLLGTAVLDLADYGVVKENLSISAPINCKRSYRNTTQPLLFLKIQPAERNRTSTSSRDSLMREPSMDRIHTESVSTLMSEEYAEEAESTTDDDVSSHSSLAVTSAADSNGSSSPHKGNTTVSKPGVEQGTDFCVNSGRKSSRSSSIDLSYDIAWLSKKITSPTLQSSAQEAVEKHTKSNTEGEKTKNEAEVIQKDIMNGARAAYQKSNTKDEEPRKETEVIKEKILNGGRDAKIQLSPEQSIPRGLIAKESVAKLNHETGKHLDSGFSYNLYDKNGSSAGVAHMIVAGRMNSPQHSLTNDETREKPLKQVEEKRITEDKGQKTEDGLLCELSQVNFQKHISLENGLLSSAEENYAVSGSSSDFDKSKHGKSVRSSVDSSGIDGSISSNNDFIKGTSRGSLSSGHKDAKPYKKETGKFISDSRVQNLENKIEVLETELRDAAAIEVSLYSVAAEHGSSMNKVHAPARRLSRLYLHAVKQNSKLGRRTAAKSVVSGLVLVAKACGNDIPRLTFWLSNSIALRVIVKKYFEEEHSTISVGTVIGKMGDKFGTNTLSSLKWESSTCKIARGVTKDILGDWENPLTFTAALQKVEAWIFSRIVESIWWQSFTPHMQSGAAKAIRRSMSSDTNKIYRTTSSVDQGQGNFSLELWKKTFRDACEKICPVRAADHDCGCLPVISKLITEQLVARLDVAMFNAILRESADEIPTDPVADPISDAEILPIPLGKASFGAGAQLKNAIGNWSRWLTDLFGFDDGSDDLLEKESSSETAAEEEQRSHDTSVKPFHLLNALSDLMMLPKDMLLSRTIRKEVCPTFGPPLIRRILNFFSPDEFCPDPVPEVVIEALNSEDPFEPGEGCIMTFPCPASPIVYQTPSAACIFGEACSHSKLTRSGSSVLKKSQTSDDELDELDSPLKGIDSFLSSPSSTRASWASKENETVRYKLLKEVWKNCE